MAKIQNIPYGFNSLFGTVGSGQYPRESVDAVAPVIETTQLYTASQIEIVVDTSAAVAMTVGSKAEVEVPAGEAWMTYGIAGILAGLSAGAANPRLSLETIRPTGSAPIQYFESLNTIAVGDDWRFGLTFPQPIVLVAGTKLQIYNQKVIAANAVFVIRATIARLTQP
jgi:hypothetical protein